MPCMSVSTDRRQAKVGAVPAIEDGVDLQVVEPAEDALLRHTEDTGQEAVGQMRVVLQAAGEQIAYEPDDVLIETTGVALLDRCVVFVDDDDPVLQTPDNERYYMHSWPIRLGCGGTEHKALHRRMIQKLDGYCAFPD